MATAVQQRRIFIGGEWVDSAGDGSQRILNPATGETIAEVPKGTVEDVDRAVGAARKAFEDTWLDTTPGERS
jgi:acyl-CoA reductase-like NAD-dependent aldehyde dehydrogenase